MSEVAKELSQSDDSSHIQPQELQLKWLKSGNIMEILALSESRAPIDPSQR
jgi:hypothetical protein